MLSVFNRPKQVVEERVGEEIVVNAKKNEVVYLYKCRQCTVTLPDKAAKFIIDTCDDLEVRLASELMSGTVDVMKSHRIRLIVTAGITIPTFTVESCEDIEFLLKNVRRQVNAIYLANATSVRVVCPAAPVNTYPLDLPEGCDSSQQCVACWTGDTFAVEAVVREGVGYPTTAAKKKQADRRAEIMKDHLHRLVNESIKIGPASTSTSSNGAAESTVAAQSSEEMRLPPETALKVPASSVSDDALLSARSQLKPTQTVERHLPVVGVIHRTTGSPRKPAPSGSSTAIADEEEKKEFFEKPHDLERKLDLLAKWVRSSKHVIVFTGAGISTSTGIPDFRSGMNTVLETGPGVWELQANKSARPLTAKTVNMLQAIPSATHMAIVEMHKKGLVKATVSQNVDGLHRRSGLPADEIAELHGNTNLETCETCKRQYLRDFDTRTAFGVFDHVTGRQCDDPSCQGRLMDSIINFGESLPDHELRKAFMHAGQADLCIVLGSSLRVTPAALVPEEVAKSGKLVICNLQRTPLDDCASLVIHAKCDDVMTGLVKDRLGLDIPPFKVHRRLRFTSEPSTHKDSHCTISVCGLDESSDIPYSFIQGIEVTVSTSKKQVALTVKKKVDSEPIEMDFKAEEGTVCHALVRIHFHGHYGEVPLELQNEITCGQPQQTMWNMSYNPMTGTWETASTTM